MLTNIDIKNFTIIEHLTLDLNTGFSALTGETGAGKSIWVDAVQIALGERFEQTMLRAGAERCEISLTFDINNNKKACAWLQEHDFDSDECVIYRAVSIDGKSKSRLNDRPVTLTALRQLRESLINIAGQHQQQLLLIPQQQENIIDEYADNKKTLIQIKQTVKQ